MYATGNGQHGEPALQLRAMPVSRVASLVDTLSTLRAV